MDGMDGMEDDLLLPLLHFANFSTLLVCMVLKLPQIVVLMRSKSTTGVSVSSLLLELLGFIVFVSYQMFYDYPPPTYLEYPILIAQDVILLILILHYNRNMMQSLMYAALFVGGWKLLTMEKWIIDMAMSVCTLISAGSKLLQLQCLWRSKNSVQVSTLTWALATHYVCGEDLHYDGDDWRHSRSDPLVAMTALNMWVMATVIYYKPSAKKRD